MKRLFISNNCVNRGSTVLGCKIVGFAVQASFEISHFLILLFHANGYFFQTILLYILLY